MDELREFLTEYRRFLAFAELDAVTWRDRRHAATAEKLIGHGFDACQYLEAFLAQTEMQHVAALAS